MAGASILSHPCYKPIGRTQEKLQRLFLGFRIGHCLSQARDVFKEETKLTPISPSTKHFLAIEARMNSTLALKQGVNCLHCSITKLNPHLTKGILSIWRPITKSNGAHIYDQLYKGVVDQTLSHWICLVWVQITNPPEAKDTHMVRELRKTTQG